MDSWVLRKCASQAHKLIRHARPLKAATPHLDKEGT